MTGTKVDQYYHLSQTTDATGTTASITSTGTYPTGTMSGCTCYNRLPCGLCKLTMTTGPMGGLTITPSWYQPQAVPTEITCKAKTEEEK